MVCPGVERCVCWSKVWCVLEWGVECAGVKFGVCWSGTWCVLEWGVFVLGEGIVYARMWRGAYWSKV